MSQAAICPREGDLLDAFAAGFVGPELSAHVADCPSCSELQLVAGALLSDRAQAIADAPLPSSGTMLWRMQMRHRHEAQAAARRSLFLGQAMTLLVAIALVGSFFGIAVVIEFREVLTAFRISTPVLIGLATWALLAPIGGYLALRQK